MPRRGKCHQALPWITDAGDFTFGEIAETTTLLVLRRRRVAARQTGAVPLAALRAWVDTVLAALGRAPTPGASTHAQLPASPPGPHLRVRTADGVRAGETRASRPASVLLSAWALMPAVEAAERR